MQRIGQSAGKSYAYLLGVYLGDGCLTTMTSKGKYTYPVFRLNSIDPDFIEATKGALADLGCERIWISSHAVTKSSKSNHSLAAKIGDIPAIVGMRDLTGDKSHLPDMSDWTRDEKLAFVSGLMDSEGFVAANSNTTNRRFYMGFKCCDPWVPDFIVLLQSLGVRIGKVQTQAPYRPGYKAPTRFTIKMQSWIDADCRFNIRRKQERVEEWASAGAYERRATFPRRLTPETTRQTPSNPAII